MHDLRRAQHAHLPDTHIYNDLGADTIGSQFARLPAVPAARNTGLVLLLDSPQQVLIVLGASQHQHHTLALPCNFRQTVGVAAFVAAYNYHRIGGVSFDMLRQSVLGTVRITSMIMLIVIGAAFGTIVKSLVADVIMPPIGLLLGNVDFSNLFAVIKAGSVAGPFATVAEAQKAGAVTINYGMFINTVISFLIVAFAVFLLIKDMNALLEM